MIEFGGVIYYIDLSAFDKIISLDFGKPNDIVKTYEIKTVTNENNKVVGKEKIESKRERGKEIDAAKYELIRELIFTLLDFNVSNDDDEDDSLGVERALEKKPLSYKIAFNTLYNYGVLKEKE